MTHTRNAVGACASVARHWYAGHMANELSRKAPSSWKIRIGKATTTYYIQLYVMSSNSIMLYK